MTGPILITCALYLLLSCAAWTDFRTLKIPNLVTVAVAGLFPIHALLTGMPAGTLLLQHASAGLAVLAAGFALFAAGKLGGGDAKLLAAVALWLGWPDLTPGLFAISLVGAAVCFALLALRASPLPLWLDLKGWHSVALENGKGAPYAIAVAAGFALVRLFNL
jgi:prepilin peptidase CpaA